MSFLLEPIKIIIFARKINNYKLIIISHLCRVFTILYLKQTMFAGLTVLQLFCIYNLCYITGFYNRNLTLYSPMVTICTTTLTLNNSTFCPHNVFLCFIWIWEQTAIISVYSISWLVYNRDLTLYITVVTMCTASLTFNNSTFCPHNVILGFVWIWEKKQWLFPYKALTDRFL